MPCSLAISCRHSLICTAMPVSLAPHFFASWMAPVSDSDITATSGKYSARRLARSAAVGARSADRIGWMASSANGVCALPRRVGRAVALSGASGARVAEAMAASGPQEFLRALQRPGILQADGADDRSSPRRSGMIVSARLPSDCMMRVWNCALRRSVGAHRPATPPRRLPAARRRPAARADAVRSRRHALAVAIIAVGAAQDLVARLRSAARRWRAAPP